MRNEDRATGYGLIAIAFVLIVGTSIIHPMGPKQAIEQSLTWPVSGAPILPANCYVQSDCDRWNSHKSESATFPSSVPVPLSAYWYPVIIIRSPHTHIFYGNSVTDLEWRVNGGRPMSECMVPDETMNIYVDPTVSPWPPLRSCKKWMPL